MTWTSNSIDRCLEPQQRKLADHRMIELLLKAGTYPISWYEEFEKRGIPAVIVGPQMLEAAKTQ